MSPVGLPPGLADLPPGPALGAALAGLDPRWVANADTVAVLAARYRQLAHEQARLLEALVEVGRADPDDLTGARRLDVIGEWAGGEIAAALTLTGVAADRELAFADTIVVRLPAVHAALSAGAIDRGKAWVFADHLADLPGDQAAAICAALLPVAPGLTTGQLRARLARMLHDIDPDHARRRYQRAVRERAVIGHLAPDGTVTVSATGLPTDEAAVACERLDILAHAIQRGGHPGRLGQIQTDLFLGMLDGSLHHLTEPEIITALLERPRPEDAEPGGPPAAGPEAAAATSADQAEPERPADAGADTEASPPTPEATGAVPHTDDTSPHAVSIASTEPRTGVEIRVGLTTLLGLDERCGELPGLGPVLPGVARTLVAAQHRGAEWRFVITDTDGLLLLAGITRRRPAIPVHDQGRNSNGIVELHVDSETLQRLAADSTCGLWAEVVADLADQYIHRAHRIPLLDQCGSDRFARAILARHVEIRDRTCCHPGCRRPARKSDKDHTRDYASGGPTTSDNVGPVCGRHHRYKSRGWWRLTQPAPGRFHWTSPLTRNYRTRGEPIRPPTVPPHPRPHTLRYSGTATRASGPILHRRLEPPRRAEHSTVNDEPPF